MPAIEGLGRKLALLADYGDLGGWPGLEQRFDRSRSTIRYWGHGNADRAPNIIPKDKFDDFRQAIADALGLSFAAPFISSLVSATPDQLEIALRSRKSKSLSALIDAEGQAQSFSLLTRKEHHVSLVQVGAGTRISPSCSVGIGRDFALRFDEAPQHSYLLMLQQSPNAWGCIGRTVLVDGQKPTIPPTQSDVHQHTYMRETAELGVHRFVMIATSDVSFLEIERYLREGVPLDLNALGLIANELAKYPHRQRAIWTARIEVVREKK